MSTVLLPSSCHLGEDMIDVDRIPNMLECHALYMYAALSFQGLIGELAFHSKQVSLLACARQ